MCFHKKDLKTKKVTEFYPIWKYKSITKDNDQQWSVAFQTQRNVLTHESKVQKHKTTS